MPASAGRPRFHALLSVTAALVCAAALAIGLTIWWLRSDAIRTAYNDSDNLSIVLAEQISNSIQSIDSTLIEIQDQAETSSRQAPEYFDRDFSSESTYNFLNEHLSHLPQAKLIALIDKTGKLVNSTRGWPTERFDFSDRDYFKHFKTSDDRGIYISNLLTERVTGERIIFFIRRINGADNTFLGVAAIGVRLLYFQQIYKSIEALREKSFVLSLTNGEVIVRYPDTNDRAGQKLPAALWYKQVLEGGGHFRSPGFFDVKPRLVSVRSLRKYPLVVNVAVSESAALASWRIQATTIGVGTLLVMLGLAILLKALSRNFHLLVSSESSLAEKANELERANAKVDGALNNMSQGLAMFDSSARLVVCNARYLNMYGLSPEVVRPGCPLRDLLHHRAAVGNFYANDIEQYMADILAAVGQGTAISKLVEMSDGRIISIINQPSADGGWVATHADVTQEKLAEERITYAAHNDELTGLPNRKLFYELLGQALKRVRRGERLAVLYLDLDYLKRVNDTLGHPAGDRLLKGVADRLRGCVRDIDVVARLSGDEFAIIQSSINDPSDAADLAIRIRNIISEPFDLDGHQVKVDISIGVSMAPDDAAELDGLLRAADTALYDAKNTGRGTYSFYKQEMNERMQTRGVLEQDLHSALVNGELELFYQPVVSLQTNEIVSCEALLRWHHPERGLISPADFIPVAEEMGLIIPIGEWVLRTACAEAATWPDHVQVAVNISSTQLANKNLVNVIVGAIASSGIKPNRLELELTESILIKNTFATQATLKSLHEFGVQFAMDDFGTGYSSLGYLLSFPFNKIKIDRSFIAGLPDKKESYAIVGAIAGLARNLGMRVTAEGVETAQQLEQVRILGCTEMQGYLFSKPRPAQEIRRRFRRNVKESTSRVSQVA
jgi:diguanylate cyclase (GGDEF)-like protein